jgi:hypothetical protein
MGRYIYFHASEHPAMKIEIGKLYNSQGTL